MGRIGEELDIDFVISTGDNFYENGLTGVNDTAFEESFSNIYTAKSLHKPWYTGNNFFATHIYIYKFLVINIYKCFSAIFVDFCVISLVLGNHDYRGDVLAQLSDAVRRIDPRFTCMRSFIVNAGKNLHYSPII